jgi:hypothetical protein
MVVDLSICLSVLLSVFLSACLSVCMSVCLSVCLSVWFFPIGKSMKTSFASIVHSISFKEVKMETRNSVHRKERIKSFLKRI